MRRISDAIINATQIVSSQKCNESKRSSKSAISANVCNVTSMKEAEVIVSQLLLFCRLSRKISASRSTNHEDDRNWYQIDTRRSRQWATNEINYSSENFAVKCEPAPSLLSPTIWRSTSCKPDELHPVLSYHADCLPGQDVKCCRTWGHEVMQDMRKSDFK